MALRSTSGMKSMVVVVMVLAAALLKTGAVNVKSAHNNIDVCPTKAVYAYWSVCLNPVLYNEGQYKFMSTEAQLMLAPEWDETNSTYYVRLAEEGPAYTFSYRTKDIRPFVSQSSTDLIIKNAETGRALGWREEGEGEFFLVELETETEGFQLVANEGVQIPCPLILYARCEAYNILDSAGEGVSPYVEDDVTYFKASADLSSALPFVLTRSSSDDDATAVL